MTQIEFSNPRTAQLPDDAHELLKKIRPMKRHEIYETTGNGFTITRTNLFEELTLMEMNQAFTCFPSMEPKQMRDLVRFPHVTRYSYHTAGYQGFFKPSLDEVIKCCADVLRDCDYAYVTSEPCDVYGNYDADVNACFNQEVWCHRGKITIWPVRICPPAPSP